MTTIYQANCMSKSIIAEYCVKIKHLKMIKKLPKDKYLDFLYDWTGDDKND